MSDEFDVAVHDAEALAEIELLTNLIIATSEHRDRLSQAQIDVLLGLTAPGQPPSPQAPADEASTG